MPEEPELKYVLYARKSSESEERQMLSIDSQIKEMGVVAEQQGLNVIETRQESHSAKASGNRPVFNTVVADVKAGKFNAILTWAPDRLSRNAGDLGMLVDLMDSGKLLAIQTPGQVFRNTPNDKFLLMILCSQAKLENDNRAKNILRGMKTKCENGWRPCQAPIGYLNQRYAPRGSKTVLVDPARAPIIREMFEKVAYEGVTGRPLLRFLNQERLLRTKNDKKLCLSMVYKILENPFYHGEFEYPVGSGKLYKGSHDPIITKELFLQARQALTTAPKLRPGSREFAFTKFMRCGNCGYGITASEKHKKLKNGSVSKYIYYHCTNKGETPCREPYIREEELSKQLLELIDQVPFDEAAMKSKLMGEMKRFSMFTSGVFSANQELKSELGIENYRNYARFVLSQGSHEERKDILGMLQAQLKLLGGKVILS